MEGLRELAALVGELTREDGVYATEIPGLYLSRYSEVDPPRHTIDSAVFCVVAQGTNSVMLRREIRTYDPGQYFLVSVDVPIVARIVRASREEPYLGVTMSLDVAEIGSLVVDEAAPIGRPTGGSATVGELDAELLDAVVRLVRLLRTPADVPVLAPLVRREISYRLLRADRGGLLREMAVKNSQVQRVAAAVERLKRDFAKPIRIADLARRANMSPASLHAWFKAVTTFSPIQFQKRLRLLEARRILYGEDADATAASYRVGYESPSQFTRDYKRLFGLPPRKDVERLRAASGGLNATPRELPPPEERGRKAPKRRRSASRRRAV